MKCIGTYKNGNYNVTVFDDGTKIRRTEDDHWAPERPESMDLKITNDCDMNCPFCHEDSHINGKHGDIMNMKFLETLMPFTELAIGGGNPLAHPDLIPFLRKCKDLKLIPSMTVNQIHFMKNQDLIKQLVDEQLIFGLGVSLVLVNSKFIETVKQYPNAVIHIINGVQSLIDIKKLYDHNLKILILGYKEFRRGNDFYSENVEKTKDEFYNELPNMVNHFKVVSFDNLATKQLECKRLVSEEEWQMRYMGDDGQFTMYIDAVKEEFAKSSTSPIRFTLTNDIVEMFNVIKL